MSPKEMLEIMSFSDWDEQAAEESWRQICWTMDVAGCSWEWLRDRDINACTF